MIALMKKALVAAAMALGAAGAVHATVIRFDFTGTVTSGSSMGDALGSLISGWLQYDTSRTTGDSTDGATYRSITTFDLDALSAPVVGQWSVSGGSSGAVGPSDYFQYSNLRIRQGLVNPSGTYLDEFTVSLALETEWPDTHTRSMGISAYINGTGPSGLFDTTVYPATDFSPDQNVHWFAPGIKRFGAVSIDAGTTYFDFATVTRSIDGEVQECQELQAGSCAALAAEVPEPGSLALLGIALGGMAIAGRSRMRLERR